MYCILIYTTIARGLCYFIKAQTKQTFRVNWFHGTASFSKSYQFLRYALNSSHFMALEDPLRPSQQAATCRCPELDQFSPRPFLFLENPF